MVGRWISFWDGLFSGAMLISGSVGPDGGFVHCYIGILRCPPQNIYWYIRKRERRMAWPKIATLTWGDQDLLIGDKKKHQISPTSVEYNTKGHPKVALRPHWWSFELPTNRPTNHLWVENFGGLEPSTDTYVIFSVISSHQLLLNWSLRSGTTKNGKKWRKVAMFPVSLDMSRMSRGNNPKTAFSDLNDEVIVSWVISGLVRFTPHVSFLL